MELIGILALLLFIGFVIGVVRRMVRLLFGIVGLIIIIGCVAMLL